MFGYRSNNNNNNTNTDNRLRLSNTIEQQQSTQPNAMKNLRIRTQKSIKQSPVPSQQQQQQQQRISTNIPTLEQRSPIPTNPFVRLQNEAPVLPLRMQERQQNFSQQDQNYNNNNGNSQNRVYPSLLPQGLIASRNLTTSSQNASNTVNEVRGSFIIRKKPSIINQATSPPTRITNTSVVPSSNNNTSNNNNNNPSLLQANKQPSRASSGQSFNDPFSAAGSTSATSSLSQINNTDILDNASNVSSSNPARIMPVIRPLSRRVITSETIQQNNNSNASTNNQFNRAVIPSSPLQNPPTNSISSQIQNPNQQPNNNDIFPRSRPSIPQQIPSQRLSGPHSQWLQRTQNALSDIDSILTQTNNTIQRVNAIQNISRSPFERDDNFPDLASNNSSNIFHSETSTEELQRELTNLDRERRQREETILRRQQYEDRMAAANRQARNRMGNDTIFRNPSASSFSSEDESIIEDIEERKEDAQFSSRRRSSNIQIPQSYIRSSSSSSCESDSDEDDIEEHSVPPVQPLRRIVPLSNPFREQPIQQFRRLNRNNDQGSQTVQSRLSAGLNLAQNRNQPPRENNNEDQQIQENQDDNNQRGGRQSNTMRVVIPLMQFMNGSDANQRPSHEGLRSLVTMLQNRLANMQGPINSQNIEDLAQMVATLRLFQTASRGLTEQQIQEFPLIQLKQVDKDEICSICLEDWQINDQAKILGCMHKFHSHCIHSWLKEKTICPNCKSDQLEFFTDKIPEALQQNS